MVRASWQPDPTQRHQYRWWDGAAWTDTVADDGRPAVDPLQATRMPVASGRFVPPVTPPPAEPSSSGVVVEVEVAPPATFVPTFDPGGARFAAQPPPRRKRYIPWGKITLGFVVAGAVVAAVIAWQAKRGDDDNTEPPLPLALTAEIAAEGGAVGRTFDLGAGQGARLRVEVPDDLVVDAYVRIPDDDGPGEKVADLCCDDGQGFVAGSVVATKDVTYQLVVVSRQGTGEVRMIVQRFTPPSELSDGEASDVLSDPFFEDSGFFSDEAAYTP